MHKHFVFTGVQAQHVKVSHMPFVGLPSITGLTGLGRAFAIGLAQARGLAPAEFQPAGICLGVEHPESHAGYVKAHKGKTTESEAKPLSFSSFTASFLIRLEAKTPRAIDVLGGEDLADDAAAVLRELRLCKGRLLVPRRPVNLSHPTLVARHTDELARAMSVLPARALLLRDASHVVESARAAALPLMDTLVAASLHHDVRPQPYRDFFEQEGFEQRRLAPVLAGYLALEAEPSGTGHRLNSRGEAAPSRFVSPTYTLAALQTAASVRALVNANPGTDYAVLWQEQILPDSHHVACLATA